MPRRDTDEFDLALTQMAVLVIVRLLVEQWIPARPEGTAETDLKREVASTLSAAAHSSGASSAEIVVSLCTRR